MNNISQSVVLASGKPCFGRFLPAMVVALSLLIPIGALAGVGDKPAKKAAKKSEAKCALAQVPARQTEPMATTGSNLKQSGKRVGNTTTGVYPVTVIDRKAIERSGAATLLGVLNRQSSFR